MQGKIVKTFGRYYTVQTGDMQINSVLRGRIKQDARLKSYSEPVCVGDVVDYEPDAQGLGIISYVHKRKNTFTRKDKTGSKEDLIAANIDQIVVVQAFAEPKFNLRFVDRILVRGAKERAPCLLCLNKQDLSVPEDLDYVLSYYKGVDLTTMPVCALTGAGCGELADALVGKTTLFIGSSGVGKSALLNKLFGQTLKTGAISQSTGKGRHTTTNAEMIIAEGETCVIDTPGLKEFGLADIAAEDLAGYFFDFYPYAAECRFSHCTHDHEPDCAVQKAADAGEISVGRYKSYLNILASLKEYKAFMY